MDHNAGVDEERPEPDGAARAAERARDATWVRAALDGDPDAFGRLYDVWFDRVFALVRRITRNQEVAREVCQDAFLSAWRNLGNLEDAGAFGGWLLRIARNAALNRAAREARSQAVDDRGLAMIERTGGAGAAAPRGFEVEGRVARAEDPGVAAADAEIVALVQDVAASLGARDAEVLDLQLRYELTPAEIGEVIGVNRNAANQLCHRVRARFATAFGARMLWNAGRPACDELAAALSAADVFAFGPEAVKVADEHVRRCEECSERRRSRLDPAALFAAVPIVGAPIAMKAKVAGALATHGVPMQGSAAGGAGPVGTTGAGAGPATTDPTTTEPVPARAGWLHRRALVVASASLVAATVVVALLLAGGGDDDGAVSTNAVARRTTTTSGSASRLAPGPTSGSRPGSAVDVPPGPTGTTKPTSGSTTTLPPTTTTVPPAVVEELVLDPSGDQGNSWSTSAGPVLRWRVTGATSVSVWTYSDDGSGPRRTTLVSNAPSGNEAVCPGTRSGSDTCTASTGRYTYVVEAKNAAGTIVTSDVANAPGFRVVQTIL